MDLSLIPQKRREQWIKDGYCRLATVGEKAESAAAEKKAEASKKAESAAAEKKAKEAGRK